MHEDYNFTIALFKGVGIKLSVNDYESGQYVYDIDDDTLNGSFEYINDKED